MLQLKVLKGIKPRIYPDFQSGGLLIFLIIMMVKEVVKFGLELRFYKLIKILYILLKFHFQLQQQV